MVIPFAGELVACAPSGSSGVAQTASPCSSLALLSSTIDTLPTLSTTSRRGDGGDQRVVDDHGGAAELGQVGQDLDAGKAGHAFGLERDAELVAAERGGDALEAAEVVEHRRRGLVLRDERSDGVTGGHVHGDVRMCVGSGDGSSD